MAKRQTSDPLSVGVIGTGILGGQHARYAASHPDVRLRAVAETRSDLGKQVSRDTGAVWYASYDEMLGEAELDLVIVATPDPLHRDPVVATARAGVKRIITEKPMATSMTDARRMQEAASKSGSELYILFPNRFNPLDRVTHYAIQKGLIGAPVHGDVRLDDNISVPTEMWGKRSKEWAGGSSTAYFLLSHVVDLLRWYFQPADIAEVYAISRRQVLEYTPDLYDAYLTFDSGLVVRVKAEWIRRMDALVEFELSFSGSKGGLVYRKHPAFLSQRGLRLDIEKSTTAVLSKHQKALAQQGIRSKIVSDPDARTPHALEFYAEENPIEWQSGLGHYFTTLRNGWSEPKLPGFGPLPGVDDAIRQVEVVDAIVKSAETGRARKAG